MELIPLDVRKDGPTQSGVHVDSIIGSTCDFTPGPQVGARCAACGEKGCKKHAVKVMPIVKEFDNSESRDDHGKWTASGLRAHLREGHGMHHTAAKGNLPHLTKVHDHQHNPSDDLYKPYPPVDGHTHGDDTPTPAPKLLPLQGPATDPISSNPLAALNIPHSAKSIVATGIAQGGFTWNVATGEEPTTGYVVAIQGHSSIIPLTNPQDPAQRKLLAQALVKFVRDNADLFRDNPAVHLGGWHDKSNQEFVLDPTEVVGDRKTAIQLGQSRNQQSIWDVAAGEEIDTGGTGDRESGGVSKSARAFASAGRWIRRRVGGMGGSVPRPSVGTSGVEREPGITLLGGQLLKAFDPSEARDATGKWTAGAGAGAKTWDPLKGRAGPTIDLLTHDLAESNIHALYPGGDKATILDEEDGDSLWRGRRMAMEFALKDLKNGADGSAYETKAADLDHQADDEQEKVDNPNMPGNSATVAFWRGQAQAYRAVNAHMRAGGYTPPAHLEAGNVKASTVTQKDLSALRLPPEVTGSSDDKAQVASSKLLDMMQAVADRAAAKNSVMMQITDRMVAVHGDHFDPLLAEKANMGMTSSQYWGSPAVASSMPAYLDPTNIVYDQGSGSFGINHTTQATTTEKFQAHKAGEVWKNDIGETIAFTSNAEGIYRFTSEGKTSDKPVGLEWMGEQIHQYHSTVDAKRVYHQVDGPTYVEPPNHPAEVPFNALRSAPGGSPEALALMRQAGISNLIHQWAETSNDNNETSLAIQEAAEREFDLQDTSEWDGQDHSDSGDYEHNGEMYRAFLRAQYDTTQKFLKDNDISSMVVYRGVDGDPEMNGADIDGSDTTLHMRPLSSWAAEEGTAKSFGQTIMSVEVPADRILSTALTGFGALPEHEVVLVGDDDKVAVTGGDWSSNNVAAQNQEVVNNWAQTMSQQQWAQDEIDNMDGDYTLDSNSLDEGWNSYVADWEDQNFNDFLHQYDHPELTQKMDSMSGHTYVSANDLGNEFKESLSNNLDFGQDPPSAEEIENAYGQFITDKNEQTFDEYGASHPERMDFLFDWSKQWEEQRGSDLVAHPVVVDARLFTTNDLDIAWDNHEKGYDEDNARHDIHDPNQTELQPNADTLDGGPFHGGDQTIQVGHAPDAPPPPPGPGPAPRQSSPVVGQWKHTDGPATYYEHANGAITGENKPEYEQMEDIRGAMSQIFADNPQWSKMAVTS